MEMWFGHIRPEPEKVRGVADHSLPTCFHNQHCDKDSIYIDRRHKDYTRTELVWHATLQSDNITQWNWPLVGDGLDPAALFAREKEHAIHLAKTLPMWQADQLTAHSERLHRLMSESDPQQMVLYVHCEMGNDRTSELIGSYELSRGDTWQQVMARILSIATRPIQKSNENALRWFCLHLKYTRKGREDLDCFNDEHQ